MYSINVQKLKGKMTERGFNLVSFAAELGISRNTLTHYFNEPDAMPYKVIKKASSLLCPNMYEAAEIFFEKKLV